jgi:hypothetical protein
MNKSVPSSVLLLLLLAASVSAEESRCKSLDDVRDYWGNHRQDTSYEADVNRLCLQNRQALGLLQIEESKKGRTKPGKDGTSDERKRCALEYLFFVNKLCLEMERALGLYYLEEAKMSAKIPGEEEAAGEHRKRVRQYLGDAFVAKELPETITLRPRAKAYEFTLIKGEQTSTWIQGESGTTTHIHFYETTNYAFEVRYKNGDVIKVWAGENVPKKPNGPFKIIATDDTTVLIIVD